MVVATDLEQLLAPANLIPAGPLVPARRLISAMEPVPTKPLLPACRLIPPLQLVPALLWASGDRSTPVSGTVPGQPEGGPFRPTGKCCNVQSQAANGTCRSLRG
jgi:hypothetical protein